MTPIPKPAAIVFLIGISLGTCDPRTHAAEPKTQAAIGPITIEVSGPDGKPVDISRGAPNYALVLKDPGSDEAVHSQDVHRLPGRRIWTLDPLFVEGAPAVLQVWRSPTEVGNRHFYRDWRDLDGTILEAEKNIIIESGGSYHIHSPTRTAESIFVEFEGPDGRSVGSSYTGPPYYVIAIYSEDGETLNTHETVDWSRPVPYRIITPDMLAGERALLRVWRSPYGWTGVRGFTAWMDHPDIVLVAERMIPVGDFGRYRIQTDSRAAGDFVVEVAGLEGSVLNAGPEPPYFALTIYRAGEETEIRNWLLSDIPNRRSTRVTAHGFDAGDAATLRVWRTPESYIGGSHYGLWRHRRMLVAEEEIVVQSGGWYTLQTDTVSSDADPEHVYFTIELSAYDGGPILPAGNFVRYWAEVWDASGSVMLRAYDAETFIGGRYFPDAYHESLTKGSEALLRLVRELRTGLRAIEDERLVTIDPYGRYSLVSQSRSTSGLQILVITPQGDPLGTMSSFSDYRLRVTSTEPDRPHDSTMQMGGVSPTALVYRTPLLEGDELILTLLRQLPNGEDEIVLDQRRSIVPSEMLTVVYDPDSPGKWADADFLDQGRLHLPWFGYFSARGGFINHEEHGWLYHVSNGGNGFYLYDFALDCWAWSSQEAYPWIYWYAPIGTWAYFYRGATPGKRWFFRADTDRIETESSLRP